MNDRGFLTKLKCKVISLTDAHDRHRAVRAQASQLELDVELKLFDRFQGERHPCYDVSERIKRIGYPLLPGEIGCFDSHRQVWEEIVRNQEITLVLEDDFLLADSSALTCLERLSTESVALIRLHGIFDKPCEVLGDLDDRQLVAFNGNPAGTLAYLLTPDAAQILLEKSARFYVPVDDFIDHEWRHGIIVQGVQPYIFESIEGQSSIGERKKPRFSFLQKLRIEFYKGLESLQNRSFKRKKRKIIAQYKSTSPAGRVLNRR